MLWHFLHFRLEVVTNRLEHELEALRKRIHILEGFEKVFDALDEIIRIIRKSDGKQDTAEKIMKRFELDAEQTDAILELKLYRLARLEILVIQNELAEKRKRARQITRCSRTKKAAGRSCGTSSSSSRRRTGAKTDTRRTLIEALEEETNYRRRLHRRRRQRRHPVARRLGEAPERSEGSVHDAPARRRSVLAVLPGSTRATRRALHQLRRRVHGRIIDVPASTGYGEPVQKLFKLKDGENSWAFSLDPRVAGNRDARRRRLAAASRHRRDERRLQPAVRPRGIR